MSPNDAPYALPRTFSDPLSTMTVVANELLNRQLGCADTACHKLKGALRQLRSARSGDDAAVRPALSLVSITLDELSAGVRTSCEVALGDAFDRDISRPHAVIQAMRDVLRTEAGELLCGKLAPAHFWPDAERTADRVIEIAANLIQESAAESDRRAAQLREAAYH